MGSQKSLLLIDGNSVAFRAFYAMHQVLDSFTNQDGLHTNAIYAFKNMLDIILKRFEPTHVLVAFDAGKTTFRTAQFADYKGGRSKTPPELTEQFPYIKELLHAYGIQTAELANYEADDIIGTLASQAEQDGFVVNIVTGDRDLTQLTTDKTTVNITVKGVNDTEAYTPEHVQEKLGLAPSQIVDLKGLMGDTSDNYPGVTKVGEKTALKLLTEFGSIEGVYENVDAMKKSKMKEHLIEDRDQAFMSKKLATILRDAPIETTLADITYEGPNIETLIAFYQEMNFQNFLKQLNVTPEAVEPAENYQYTVLTLDNLETVQAIKTPVAFGIEMLTDNYHIADLIGFYIGAPDHWYVSDDVALLAEPVLKDWLEDASHPKAVFDVKRTQVAANRLGVHLAGVNFDLLLASYLLNTTNNSNDLGTVANLHQYQNVQTDEAVYGKGAKRAVPTEPALLYQHLVQKAAAIYHLHPQLEEQLKEHQQFDLFTDMELPLALVLAQMEITGIRVDASRLQQMGSEFSQTLKILEEKVYAEAGETFNINSPKQLGVILFEKMGLPVIKKTKTGYSTAVDVLEQLRKDALIVQTILDYRQIAKIQSTYVEGLLKSIHQDNKVHTRYLQTLTQTGRLSSVDPNLQNIPVRLAEGRKIRQAFVPSHPDWQMFASDYSQIELRVLAHISGDANMQEAFKEDRDIHANTAMKIFGLNSADQVTPDMRRQAKATNFGIVYGISDYGLSQNIGISRQEAKRFIDAYFEQYPGVQQFMVDIVKKAREEGYVETLFHRRRYLPDIHAKNFNLRSFAERTAMNTPIQGSAADIIKVAMILMQQELKKANLQARMLLQVHDELIFEAPTEEIPILQKLVPSVMDSAVKLAVPLKVESGFGPTWYDIKK
ncbi:DNA polymerase I [Latilactobacillus sakei subsp. sakei]|uniref:DNA polymerase I n=1 Tax=Latilactobacillus sakei TaxID=1599 RepID=UPI002857EF02|nr:DNA polymerase I [Latilactobacillus sakei]MDR7923868.1 DNA polymerase I [Latilactobacillus sakei subsp. sakei]